MENDSSSNLSNTTDGDIAFELPLTLRTSRGIFIGGILMSAMFAAISLWMYMHNKEWPALVGTLLFALLTLLFVLGLLYPITLQIDETGFTLSRPLSKRKTVVTVWQHIEQFGVVNIGRPYVAYQVTESSGRRRIPGGYMLPAFAGMPTPALAALLETCREHFTATAQVRS
ncbi:hypothetical protein [Dyella tabacisoli]|uniref:Uncharacterized protein n=1 Tax=Dyella tabacisoli TaxID=2282381 RepID=A0A369UT37_9GAMM|nr:hypothetical protein [Dyella tabacisoli]RDD83215.1 hypothetical protein DVJ77_01015 [Dyella tabacisoli]